MIPFWYDGCQLHKIGMSFSTKTRIIEELGIARQHAIACKNTWQWVCRWESAFLLKIYFVSKIICNFAADILINIFYRLSWASMRFHSDHVHSGICPMFCHNLASGALQNEWVWSLCTKSCIPLSTDDKILTCSK